MNTVLSDIIECTYSLKITIYFNSIFINNSRPRIFDPINICHKNYDDYDKNKVRNDKPVGFGGRFDKYLASVTDDTMIMYIAKKYYDNYINKEKTDRSITFRV